MFALLTTLALVLQPLATVAAVPMKDPIDPIVLKAELIANITDPRVTRDGCTSTTINKKRTLWTCGDTMVFNGTRNVLPLVVNTAGWSDLNDDGTPKITTDGPIGAGSNGSNPILQMYGSPTAMDRKPFYGLWQPDACKISSAGNCADGSRTVVWQGSAPMVVSSDPKGKTIGYSWPMFRHLQGMTPLGPATYSLYKVVYDATNPDREALPSVSLVDPCFWGEGEIPYGNIGRFVVGGYAYLYGQMKWQYTGLAKVAIKDIEDKSKYQYFVNGEWCDDQPSNDDKAARVDGAGFGRGGTFFHSQYLDSYVVIGQRNMSLEANFYMSTAPKPEGPWKKPVQIYSGENGDATFPSYALHAHPDFPGMKKKQNGIYLSWTQSWKATTYAPGTVQPMVYVTFK